MIEKYDSTEDTLKHILLVQEFILKINGELLKRARLHDKSKLESPEKEYFDKFTPLLSEVTYGSKEYRDMLEEMKPAIEHHHQNNRHHPEHFYRFECNGCFKEFVESPNVCDVCGYSQFTKRTTGIYGMDLVDIIEMFCDWKAATLRHNDGDLEKSIKINAKRHHIGKQLGTVFSNTKRNMRW